MIMRERRARIELIAAILPPDTSAKRCAAWTVPLPSRAAWALPAVGSRLPGAWGQLYGDSERECVTAFARGPNDGMIVLGGPLAQLHRGKFLGPDRQVVASRPRR